MTRHTRRAFALPLVVMLSLVVALLAAVALDRSMAQARTVKRQLERYSTHHFMKGLEGLVDGFNRAISNRPLQEVLDPSGLAFTVETDSGVGLVVSFFDNQDALLEVFDGFTAEDRMLAEGALARLVEAVGVEQVRSFTRKVGPLAVSAATASEPVLRAVLDAALNGDNVDRAVSAVMQARRNTEIAGSLTREELAAALDGLGLDPRQRARLDRVLVAQPVVWRFVVEPAQSSANDPKIRYEGVAIIAPPNADRGVNVPKGTTIVDMRKVEEEPQTASE